MTKWSDFRRQQLPTRTGVHSTSLSTLVLLWLPKEGEMCAGSAAPIIMLTESMVGGYTHVSSLTQCPGINPLVQVS